MRSEPDKDEPFGFEGPEIIKCKGYVYGTQMPRRSIKVLRIHTCVFGGA